MKHHHLCLEVPVEYRLVRRRRVTPFYWALLQALKTFPPGARPDFTTLARNLRLEDPLLLEEAWADLTKLPAADDADFLKAHLSPDGADALTSGFFTLGPDEERSCLLFFEETQGHLIPKGQWEARLSGPLQSMPGWTAGLSTEKIAEALRQIGLLEATGKLHNARISWSKARRVRLLSP